MSDAPVRFRGEDLSPNRGIHESMAVRFRNMAHGVVVAVLIGGGAAQAHVVSASPTPPKPKATKWHATAPPNIQLDNDVATALTLIVHWNRAVWDQTVWWNGVIRQQETAARAAAARRIVAASTSTHSMSTATSTPTHATSSGGCSSGYVHDLIVAAFPNDTSWALSVANRESHCTAGAHNSSGCGGGSFASGVFQICWPMHQRLAASVGCNGVFDAACNVAMAHRLYSESGRGPWGG